MRGPGRMGGGRDHPARPDRRRGDPGAEPAARARRRSRADAAAPWRCGPMARTAPVLGGGTVDARRDRVRGALQHAARARDRARRAERAPAGHRLDQDPRRGLRRRRQAVAPEGHRPRPRRLLALAGVDRRRHRVRPARRATTRSRSTARRAAPRCAARSRCTPSASRWRCSTPASFDAPSTKQAAELLDEWGADRARRSCCSTEDEARRRQVVPQPRARRRDAGRATPASPTSIGAASLLVSEAALPAAASRARPLAPV